MCVCFSGLLHRDEEWPSNGYSVFDGGASQLGHADHCEFTAFNSAALCLKSVVNMLLLIYLFMGFVDNIC